MAVGAACYARPASILVGVNDTRLPSVSTWSRGATLPLTRIRKWFGLGVAHPLREQFVVMRTIFRSRVFWSISFAATFVQGVAIDVDTAKKSVSLLAVLDYLFVSGVIKKPVDQFHFFVAQMIVFAFPMVMWFGRHTFEVNRWKNSDFSPYAQSE